MISSCFFVDRFLRLSAAAFRNTQKALRAQRFFY
jgi:hypothetical protein